MTFLLLEIVICTEAQKFFDFEVEDGFGKKVSLSHFKGKVLLVVNVASECGYTDNHYRALVRLQAELGPENFQVLAFPCNDFGNQEPRDTAEVMQFVRERYGLNFPIFGKVKITKSQPISPLFQFLQEKTKSQITWNFFKFLISTDGEPIGSWGPQTSVSDITQVIKDQIPTFDFGGIISKKKLL
ncbi:hypothetical protein HELRODRAFT_156659 [Helobdella robusta]|uniref:Glutathione peroxidase n=1 Tax=Helobdella robusta TaxID=6412 RepID=T1ELZ6_HELRO|nr:hypothetical protein HELRODRAFT_156659 [Helobdella robusta]ESO08132.1 hypothetical protein HELRODRAFT_156659 [Helobdella robusta]